MASSSVYAIRRVQTKDALPRLCKIWQQGHMSAGDARNEPEKNLFGKSTRRRQNLCVLFYEFLASESDEDRVTRIVRFQFSRPQFFECQPLHRSRSDETIPVAFGLERATRPNLCRELSPPVGRHVPKLGTNGDERKQYCRASPISSLRAERHVAPVSSKPRAFENVGSSWA